MLSQRLRFVRKKEKLTQEDLGRKVNTTKGTISNYENSHSTPSNDMLLLLADTLNTTTDYLLGRIESPEPIKAFRESRTNKKLTAEEEFEAFANDPELERWYKELPKNKEEDLQSLKQMWEIIKKNRK